MELSGEEQKLQALFSEAKAADEQVVPRFATVWNRAQLAPRRRAFTPAFVGVTALIVCALISVAIWSRYAQRSPQPIPVAKDVPPANPPATIAAPAATAAGTPKVVAPSEKPRETITARIYKSKSRRTTQVAAANRKLTQDAKTISNWQSPTAALLSSSSDQLFSSVPQFNESIDDLKSFLPNRPK